MSEFFLELFSEEIPPSLQIHAKENIKLSFEKNLSDKGITFTKSQAFSTPNRLVILIQGIPSSIEQKEKILKGPKVDSPSIALEGFIKSNNLDKTEVYKKTIEKGEFYFAKKKSQSLDVFGLLEELTPSILQNYSWKKSMKWSNFTLDWGRPLRSILALFDKKQLNFQFHHLNSENFTIVEESTKNTTKQINSFESYLKLMQSKNIILDNDKRKKIITSKLSSICKARKNKYLFSEKLINEVSNLVEKPHVITCKFDKIFLEIPKEILIVTMQQHQKYFPTFDQDNNLTNSFIVVTNLPDAKGFIKEGNERVMHARLSDARFFWEKNKKQNLVKQISKLKNLTFYNKLGTIYDKTQRLRQLGSSISDHLKLNKEKVEIACSLCKVDLISDLVGEYPELQGTMGKYFAKNQGFEKDISEAISEHYLPIGLNSPVTKKPISRAVSITDKIDTLVGFFGINEKPTSSKDPFALRRNAIGLLKTIILNNLTIPLKEIINYSTVLYSDQNFNFLNSNISKDILLFLKERMRGILKEKNIRNDIIEASISSFNGDDFTYLYRKCLSINKNVKEDTFIDIVSTYKRASNIIGELKNSKKIFGQPDTVLFSTEHEKILYDKINDIRKYFSKLSIQENFEETLKILAETKPISDNFFENVIVNDKNLDIKMNRLELLKMFCRTYEGFLDFSKMEGV